MFDGRIEEWALGVSCVKSARSVAGPMEESGALEGTSVSFEATPSVASKGRQQ